MTQVSDAVGTRTFSFNSADLTLTIEAINTSGDPQLYYRHITREYEPEPDDDQGSEGPSGSAAVGFVVGRRKKIQIGISVAPNADSRTSLGKPVHMGRVDPRPQNPVR